MNKLRVATVGLVLVLLLLALPAAARAQASSSVLYFVPERGATTFATFGVAGSLIEGYARVQPAGAGGVPGTFAILGSVQNDILVTETSVPASIPTLAGSFFAEAGGSVNTGIALVNPNTAPVTVSFTAHNSSGVIARQGNLLLSANTQLARFITELPFNVSSGFAGAMQITSSLPIVFAAVRIVTDPSGQFLMTNVPITSKAPETATAIIPEFVNGGGWKTRVHLLNPTDANMTGTIQFFSQGSGTTPGVPIALNANGLLDTTFNYTILPRGSFVLETSGTPASTQLGSVRIAPAGSSLTPFSFAILSFERNGVVITETALAAQSPSTGLRLYVDALRIPGQTASFQSAVAITNTSSTPATVNFELRNPDGTNTNLSAIRTIPAFGQTAQFLRELFPALPDSFRGLLRITSIATPIVVGGFRDRYNELGNFLIDAVPVSDETLPSTTGELILPQIVDGAGFNTQFVLFSSIIGLSGNGTVRFFGPTGFPLNLNTQ